MTNSFYGLVVAIFHDIRGDPVLDLWKKSPFYCHHYHFSNKFSLLWTSAFHHIRSYLRTG